MTESLGGSAGEDKTHLPPGAISETLKWKDIENDRELQSLLQNAYKKMEIFEFRKKINTEEKRRDPEKYGTK